MESEDEFEESTPYKGVPATIVLINIFDTSFKTAEVAHAATCGMVRQYLRQSTSQCVAVCLYGTEDTTDVSKLDAKSVIEVFPLTPPTLDDFMKLKNLNITNVQQAKELMMSDALLHCSKMFQNCKKLLSTRTIIVLSRLDTPPTQSDQKPALKKVEDLVDLNVNLRLINIAEQDYKINQFYEDFYKEANKGRDTTLPEPMWSTKEIKNVLIQDSHRHLAVARISFEIGNELNIGVGVYSLMKSQGQARHKTSNLDRETNAVLTSDNKPFKVSTENGNQMDVDENSEEKPTNQVPLLKSESLYSQEYGGERVEFTANEMKTIKNPFGPPMLKLLGFKPAILMCKEKWYLKRSYFLFPNEGIIEGSTVAFKALHQACVETGMVAICILCTRVNSRPINVALAPCTKPLSLDIDVGFDVICIPFVENVRDIPYFEDADEMDVSGSYQKVLKDIIGDLKFTYKPEIFENPKLQSEYLAIEQLAFTAVEDDEVGNFVDTTQPPNERFQSINYELFYQTFGPFLTAPVKRPVPAKEVDTNKKLKYEEIDQTLLQDRMQTGQVNKYTVPELRKILKSKEIPGLALNGLKKAELVELVCKHF